MTGCIPYLWCYPTSELFGLLVEKVDALPRISGDVRPLTPIWAEKNGNEFVMAEDVEKAVEEKEYRSNLIEQKIQELMEQELPITGHVVQAVGATLAR